jgi:hypothetical protein
MGGQLHDPFALPQGKDPGTHWREGYVDPTAGLEAVTKMKSISL